MKGLGKEKREVFLVQLGLSWPGKNGSEGCDRVSEWVPGLDRNSHQDGKP
jgi:hypothetical protein